MNREGARALGGWGMCVVSGKGGVILERCEGYTGLKKGVSSQKQGKWTKIQTGCLGSI